MCCGYLCRITLFIVVFAVYIGYVLKHKNILLMASGNFSSSNAGFTLSQNGISPTLEKQCRVSSSGYRVEQQENEYPSGLDSNGLTTADRKVTLRSVFGVMSDRGAQKPIVDMLAERDQRIEFLLNQLAIEKQERYVMEGAYNASLSRLRQSVVNQGDLSAAEAAAESRLLARETELVQLKTQFEAEREKIIVDLEEALRQRDESLHRQRELEQRLAVADQKTRERGVKYVQLKEKYGRLKERCRELAESLKKMEAYMASLPTIDELEKVEEKNRQLMRDNVVLQNHEEKLQAEVTHLHGEKLELGNLCSEQEAVIVEMKSEIERLENELKPVLHLSVNRAGLADKPLDYQIGIYQKIVSDLEREVDKQKQIAHVYNGQLVARKREMEDLRSELMAKIGKGEDDVRILQTELDSKEREVSRLSAEVRRLHSINQDHLVVIEDFKQQVRNFNSLASGDAGVLHEDLVEKMYRCVDKCKRLETALSHLVKAALPNKGVCTAMANSVDVTELLSTTVPVVVFEDDLDTSSKLQALIKHSDAIGEGLDKTHDSVMHSLAAVQAEAFPW